jgi:hypothetical protein
MGIDSAVTALRWRQVAVVVGASVCPVIPIVALIWANVSQS